MGFSKVWDFYFKAIFSTIQTMGQTPLAQSIKIPTRSPFSNVDLVSKDGLWHGGQNKMVIEIAYIPMLVSLSFCKVNEGMQISMECNIQKNLSHQ
jgi:hypothetical protein